MKPVKVSDLELVFGGNMKKLLPPIDDIPKEFHEGNTKWNKVVNDWFFNGLKKCKWTPKEGIDTQEAIKHIAAIMGSFEPKHEHKIAGCAYLLSEFFENVEYTI